MRSGERITIKPSSPLMKLIRLEPNHSEAYRWRGDALLNKHEFDKALSEYDEAIRLDPKNGMAYCGRGAALTREGGIR